MTRALSEARNATTARAREAEVLKQELAQLRAGSSAAAEPSAPEDGGKLIQHLTEIPLPMCLSTSAWPEGQAVLQPESHLW